MSVTFTGEKATGKVPMNINEMDPRSPIWSRTSFYQYAKIVARSAFCVSDGKEAKSKHYGFIKKTFSELKSGAKLWSEITREDWQLIEAEKRCAYCGPTKIDGLSVPEWF